MNKLKLKIPPPAWFLLCAGLMWLLAQWLPTPLPNYQNTAVLVLSSIVAAIGFVIAMWAVFSFHRSHTTHSPFSPEKTAIIVNWGIYAKSRNPMYLSLLLGLATWALLLGSLFAWLVLPLFVWLITHFQIEPEEQILAEKFGQDYLDYKAKVRRWI